MKLTTVLFQTTSKGIKYTGINLAKEVQALCTKNYKALLKEINDDFKKKKGKIADFVDWKT